MKISKIFGRTSKSEYNAWKESMEYMYKVLTDNNIPNNVELQLSLIFLLHQRGLTLLFLAEILRIGIMLLLLN